LRRLPNGQLPNFQTFNRICTSFGHKFCATQTHQAFLRNGCDQRAAPGVDASAAETARAPGTGAVLHVEHPLVGPERPVIPERVIEARELDVRVEEELAVGDQGGVQQLKSET